MMLPTAKDRREGRRALRVTLVSGFNLLPHRQQAVQRARRRWVIAVLGGLLAGCVAVLALAGWQIMGRAQLDAQREVVEHALAELSEPLAEHARLVREDAEFRQRTERAATLAAPLAYLLDLLDTLGDASGQGVLVRQLRFNQHDAEVLATATGQPAFATWTDLLGTTSGVKGVDVVDLRRAGAPDRDAGTQPGDAPLAFAARLRWEEAMQARAPSQAQAQAQADPLVQSHTQRQAAGNVAALASAQPVERRSAR